MFCFLHTSDLHLGKRFGNFDGDLPSRLREARHQVIAKLADLAQHHHADAILLAGDSFDSETPAAPVRRQALTTMAAYDQIKWVILPGNHDSLQAAPLWESLKREAADNIILAIEPKPISLAPHVTLLPAPCTSRHPGRDLTAWMDGCATPDGVIRLGLAHGSIRNFCENGRADDIIAPDRAKRAKLDYLALGDWHGRVEIDPRSHYCGTPEPDRFKHDAPATALLVTVEAAGLIPQIQALPTASFRWQTLTLSLAEMDDPISILHHLLPTPLTRRQTLLRINTAGYMHLEAHSQFTREIEDLRSDFAYLAFDDQNLNLLYETTDLDQIDKAGALRVAANELLREAQDESSSFEKRAIANAALARLYHYARGINP